MELWFHSLLLRYFAVKWNIKQKNSEKYFKNIEFAIDNLDIFWYSIRAVADTIH